MIWLIIFLALIIRLINLDQSLWLDEAITAQAAKNYSLVDLVSKFAVGDVHPPAHYVLIWIWLNSFGNSETVLRLTSVIFGVASVGILYLTGKRLFNNTSGLLGALFLAIAPLHIYYSQELRVYSLVTFAVCLINYFFIRLSENKIKFYLGYFIASLLVLFSDYMAYFIFPAHLLYIIFYERTLLKKYLVILGILFIAWSPWLFVFIKQLSTGIETTKILIKWAEIVGGTNIKNLALIFIKTIIGRISFDNKLVYGGIIVFITIIYSLLFYYFSKLKDKKNLFLLFCVVIPIILTAIVSVFIPVLAYFRLLYIVPIFYLLVAQAILTRKKQLQILFTTVLVFISISAVIIFNLNSKFHREDWRSALQFLQNQTASEDLIVLENTGIIDPYIYYWNGNTKTIPGLKSIPAKSLDDVVDMDMQKVKRIFVIEYLVEITDPNRLLEKKLINNNFVKKQTFNFNGVGFIHQYEKN